MQVRYTSIKKRASLFSKQLMVVVGLLALPITLRFEKAAEAQPAPPSVKPIVPSPKPPRAVVTLDPRTVRLSKFLGRLHCPVAPLAGEFVDAADANHLDWRLLPSISLVESSGGKNYRGNNIFGWGQGLQVFPTIRSGIQEVAYRLGRSALYRNRDLVSKLHLYNPDVTYADRVLAVMRRISPVPDIKPDSSLTGDRQFSYASD